MFGSQLGRIAGGALGRRFGGGSGQKIGEVVGEVAGSYLPFSTGGRVPGKKGKPLKALVHGQEYVLPVGVKPTKAQKSAVAKRKAKAKGKKHK